MKYFDVKISTGALRDWASREFRVLEVPGKLVVPLASDEPTEPARVKPPGTAVMQGEPLTEAMVESSHTAVAPVDGVIGESTRAILLNGRNVPAVELTTTVVPGTACLPWEPFTPESRDLPLPGTDFPAALRDLGPWIDRLRNCGIWSHRQHSPDLIGQLHGALRRPIDAVICNLLDSDPDVPTNTLLANHFAHDMALGLTTIGKLIGASKLWAVEEAGTPVRWWEQVPWAAREAGMRLIFLRNDYPQGDPTLLMYTLLRRRLRPDRLPVEQGALMIDAATAIAIGRCVAHHRPMLQVPLAIHDHVSGTTQAMFAAIGMPVREVMAQAGVPIQHRLLRAGSLLRDLRIVPDAVIGGGELVIHATAVETPTNPDPCIRCGWCVEGCPTRIQPAGLLEASQHNDQALAEHFGIDACIECGICSYVCPSNLPLLEGIRKLKLS